MNYLFLLLIPILAYTIKNNHEKITLPEIKKKLQSLELEKDKYNKLIRREKDQKKKNELLKNWTYIVYKQNLLKKEALGKF